MTQDTGLVVEINDQNDAESASLIVNSHHQVIDLHPSIEAIMAWPKADLIGHLLEELVHPEDLPALAGLLSWSEAETNPQVILIRLQHALEGWVWACLTETDSDTSEQRQFTVIRQPKPETHPQAKQVNPEVGEDLTALVSAQSQVLVFDQALNYLWSSAGFTTVFATEHQDLQGASLS